MKSKFLFVIGVGLAIPSVAFAAHAAGVDVPGLCSGLCAMIGCPLC